MKAERTDALNARLATKQAALTDNLADPPTCRITDDLLDDGLVQDARANAAVDNLIARKAAPRGPPADRQRRTRRAARS